MSLRDAYVAIADPTRREILNLLRDKGRLPAGVIAANFKESSRPGISRHLRVLKECGVVISLRDGKRQNYELKHNVLAALREGWLSSFSANQMQSLDALRSLVEKQTEE